MPFGNSARPDCLSELTCIRRPTKPSTERLHCLRLLPNILCQSIIYSRLFRGFQTIRSINYAQGTKTYKYRFISSLILQKRGKHQWNGENIKIEMSKILFCLQERSDIQDFNFTLQTFTRFLHFIESTKMRHGVLHFSERRMLLENVR